MEAGAGHEGSLSLPPVVVPGEKGDTEKGRLSRKSVHAFKRRWTCVLRRQVQGIRAVSACHQRSRLCGETEGEWGRTEVGTQQSNHLCFSPCLFPCSPLCKQPVNSMEGAVVLPEL